MTSNKTVRAQVRSLITGEYVWMNVIQKEPMTAPDDVRARLLPCPFCGSTDAEVYPADRERTRWNVCCGNPGCVTRGDNDYWMESDAIAAWNRRAAHADLAGEVRDSNGRSAKDYAIEQAGYMARGATRLIAAVNDLELARQQFDEGEGTEDAVDAAEQSLGDALSALRSCIYEFEKRRDHALAKFTQEKPNG